MRLQAMHTQLHEKYHALSLKVAENQDMMTGKETEVAELRNQVEELQYDLSKTQQHNYKLEHHLAEALEQIKNIEHTIEEEKQPVKTVSSVSQKKVNHFTKNSIFVLIVFLYKSWMKFKKSVRNKENWLITACKSSTASINSTEMH